MNPSTGNGISQFSPCSIGNICSAIGRNSVKSFCLSNNKDVTLITGQQCGNGIVEPGEECDCGGTASCGDNSCCDATTCKFKNGAVCDDSNEECCSNCQLASAATVCRASTGECDPEEKCSGNSPTCPADTTAPDGQGCGDGLKCATGHCTSRDQQCKTLMGSYTQGNDTYACDSLSCTLSCASPEFGSGVCYGLQQNFLDGTPCGGGGKCSNVSLIHSPHSTHPTHNHHANTFHQQGQCKGSNFGKEIKSWIDDHKGLVIGIASALGALILLMILSCMWRAYKRRKYGKVVAARAPWPGARNYRQAQNGTRGNPSQFYPAPPPMRSADPYEGSAPPPYPGGWAPGGGGYPQYPRQSVRYA
jgi:hypothetical protein